MAVKVTGKPWQDGLDEQLMETLTGRFGFMVMSTWFEFAGLPVAQEKLEVNWLLIISPFDGE